MVYLGLVQPSCGNTREELRKRQIEGGSEDIDINQREIPLASFDVCDEGPVHIGLSRKVFLCPISLQAQ